MFEPQHTGISYSFTADGFYEEAHYRAISNRSCIPLPMLAVRANYAIQRDAPNVLKELCNGNTEHMKSSPTARSSSHHLASMAASCYRTRANISKPSSLAILSRSFFWYVRSLTAARLQLSSGAYADPATYNSDIPSIRTATTMCNVSTSTSSTAPL